MILQALCRYYDILSADPECPIARPGYSTVTVGAALILSAEGELRAVIPQVEKRPVGKKTVEGPRKMVVPEHPVRTLKVSACFLCDTSAYVLGISEKDPEKPAYAAERFRAFQEYNLRLLERVDSPTARAVRGFLLAHDPKTARDSLLIQGQLDLLLGNANLVFQLEGSERFAHEEPEMRQVWAQASASSPGEQGMCLVTGEWTPIARLHPSLKGVRDAQSSGAALVSFNAPAYESYNRKDGQGWNAPTGERAAFAYTTALNFLLSRQSDTPKFTIGDTTVVYWAESTNKAFSDTFAAMFDPGVVEAPAETPGRDPEAARRMRAIAEKVKRGEALDAAGLLEGLDMDKDTPFYVLGLAPNAARISVRFFLEGPFIQIVRRIAAHYEDLAVEREYADQPAGISPYRMVQETVSPKASEGKPSPLLGGALMRAVLEGTPYPAALYYGILTRIRVDADDKDKGIHKINYRRAAVIKAYLTRKLRSQTESPIKEVLCMSLNEQSTHPAYLLGRLFAVLEKAQGEALGGAVNATIKDRYFSTACASPASVFPVLLRLAQHHIAKAKDGYDSDCQIQDILDMLQMDRNPIPRHLSLDDQGVFVLGYYHQRAAFNRPKNGQPAETTPIAETH